MTDPISRGPTIESTRRTLLIGGLVAALGRGVLIETDAAPAVEPQTVPDAVVTNRRELERAFEGLSGGETIWISDEGAPYRTTTWLDIDVSDVTVLGPGNRELIVPADGA